MDKTLWVQMTQKEREQILAQYRMTCDYHTHTIYSHGKGTIEDNVREAVKKGLKAIGISDHGPGHLTYGLSMKNVPQMKKEIEELQQKYPDIQILLGVEANTIMTEPYIDMSMDDCSEFDYIMAGYHYGTRRAATISNYVITHLGIKREKCSQMLVKNTNMILNTLYQNEERNNHISVLTHPGDKGPFDIEDIARACQDTRTYMEINNRHGHLSVEEIRIAAGFDVKFIIGSDAHSPSDVGGFKKALGRAMEAGLETDRIVNIEKA